MELNRQLIEVIPNYHWQTMQGDYLQRLGKGFFTYQSSIGDRLIISDEIALSIIERGLDMNFADFVKNNGKGNNAVNTTNDPALAFKNRMQAIAKKGIIAQSTDMGIEKFAEVEKLRNAIMQLQKDVLSLCNAFSPLQESVLAQEKMLLNIATSVMPMKAMQGQLDSIASRITLPVPTTINKASNAPAPTITNAPAPTITNDPMAQWYKVFMGKFKSPFCKSKEMDKAEQFTQLASSIDWTLAPDALDKAIRAQWASYKKVDASTYCGAPQLKDMVAALIESFNIMNSDHAPIPTPNAKPVLDTNYWIKTFNGNGPMVSDMINAVKPLEAMDEEIKTLITDYALSTGDYDKATIDGFIDWLKGFTKGKK